MRGAHEPTVASRDPGVLEFGDVELSGPDPFAEAHFADARRDAFASGPWATTPRAQDGEDPLAGLSLADLGASVEPATPAAILPTPVEAPPLVAAPAPPVERTVTQAPPAPAPEPEPEHDAAAEAEHSRKRLKSVGFNALSLIALVALAVVLFQVWRGRQAHLAPAARGAATAVGISSAPYVTASGSTVVVVRGKVRVTEPLRKVTLRAELLDGGRPVASGTATAGAAATVEEIHAVSSGADAETLARSVAARAPARLTAGDEVPFSAVIADPPANLRNLDVRVSVQPER